MRSKDDTGGVSGLRTGLSIAEAAELTGLTPDTLRYYEKDGLMLRSVPRATSGHRQYAEDDLDWIRLITKLRATGMPIRLVRLPMPPRAFFMLYSAKADKAAIERFDRVAGAAFTGRRFRDFLARYPAERADR